MLWHFFSHNFVYELSKTHFLLYLVLESKMKVVLHHSKNSSYDYICKRVAL